MTLRRGALAASLAAGAVFALLLAHDLRAWEASFERGDTLYARSPAATTWTPSTILPSGLSGRLLDAGDDLEARRAIRLFRVADAARGGLDTALERQGTRARAELSLAGVARDADPTVASQASDLLGVLAFGDYATGGGRDADQAGRAASAFGAAVRLDPRNVAAKVNLELVLRLFAAHGVRPGASSSAGGTGNGRRGAGGGLPGRGY